LANFLLQPKQEEEHEAEQCYIMRSFMIFANSEIILGLSNEGG